VLLALPRGKGSNKSPLLHLTPSTSSMPAFKSGGDLTAWIASTAACRRRRSRPGFCNHYARSTRAREPPLGSSRVVNGSWRGRPLIPGDVRLPLFAPCAMDQRKRSSAYPPHVGTLGSTIRIGHGLDLYCLNRECQHRATVDMAALAARYGRTWR
jgi:hypothetical protein